MLIDQNNNILLGSRIKSDETKSWCLPGGKIESQESLEIAAIRELMEETNLDLSSNKMNIKPFLSFIDITLEHINVTFGLVYEIHNDDLKQKIKVTEPHIFESWNWFNLTNLPEPLFPASKVMIDFWLNRPIDQNWKTYPLVN